MKKEQKIVVLPGDNPDQKKINWFIREYTGSEVFFMDETGKPINVPLTNESDLKPGMEIVAPTLFGYCYATVKQEKNSLYWENEGLMGILEFGQDDRNCWITTACINKRAIKKLRKSTSEA